MSSIVVAGDVSGTCTLQAPSAAGSTVLTLPVIATDTLAGIAATQTLTNKTLVAPALGTPASGVLTNCTGVAKAALPAGSVLQVVNATSTTQTSTGSTSFINVGSLSATITPTSATSKIFIIISTTTQGTATEYTSIARGATELSGGVGMVVSSVPSNYYTPTTLSYLDSPATTSATTYYMQGKVSTGTGYWVAGLSTITLMEIAV